MPWRYDEETRRITLPSGDTMTITFTFSTTGFALKAGDAAVFAVVKKNTKGSTEGTLMEVASPIDPLTGSATFRASNALTRGLTPGTRYYDVRIVTDPEYDEGGNIVAGDEGDNVISLYSGTDEGLPEFVVTGVAGSV